MSTFGPSNVFIGAAIYCVEKRKKKKKILKKNKGVKKWKRKKEKKEKWRKRKEKRDL